MSLWDVPPDKLEAPMVDRRDFEKVMRNSHIACHAAATSWILNRTLKFDPSTESFVDDQEANGLRSRPARNWAG